MTKEENKQLLKAQQGELDAVLLYRKLSELVDDKEYKEKFLKIASDEGKHASILKKYTSKVLKAKSLKANFIATMYKILGREKTMKILINGELKASEGYSSLVNKYTNIKEIMDDEIYHAEILKGFLNKDN